MLKSKKSPTVGPTERTPKPEYLIARSQLPERGLLGFGPITFLMDKSVMINPMVGSVVDLIDFSHPDAFGPSGWNFDAKTAFLTNEAGPPKRQPKKKVLQNCQVSFSDHPKPLQGWGKFHVNPLAYEIFAVFNWKRVPCLEWIWSFFASCFTSQTLKKSVEGLCMKAYLSTCEINPGNLFSADTALRRGAMFHVFQQRPCHRG